MHKNIELVGLPDWSENDQTLAKAVQKELGNKSIEGLARELRPLGLPIEKPVSGGSDDIGRCLMDNPNSNLTFSLKYSRSTRTPLE